MEELQLWCCAEGDRTYFKVSIISSQDIDTLKVKIYNTAPNFFTGCDPKGLTLTKVDVDLDSVMGAIFRGQYQPDVKDELLSPHREISNVWPEQPPRQNLHVFITMEGREHKRKRDDATATVVPREVKLLRTETGKAAPSALAAPSEFNLIVGVNHAIGCNRPFEPDTLPLILHHEAFGIFRDRCKAPPSKRALTFLGDLTVQACKWYQEETQRRVAIQSVFRDHLGVQFHAEKVPHTEFTTDGNLLVTIMPAAVRECKNEAGSALNQAILYYSQFLSQALADRHHFYNFGTSFPCILMVDMGSLIGFYGAAWDGKRVRVEPLAPGLDLATHWKERSARYAMASCFDAFALAIENIQAHYGLIFAEAQVNQAHPRYDPQIQKARGYPFLTSYNDGGQETSFTYDERLEEDRLVFSATVNQPGSEECIVKFTCQYSEAAHNYLASRSLAPMIRKCIRISADWIAVVMDKSNYRVLHNLPPLSKSQRAKVKRKVKSIVETLHEGGFVHGDIRDANLLIDEASLTSNDVAVHLIDFDWAGCIGEAKYPMGTNCETVRRPVGVEGGEVITEQHDIDMANYLFAN